MLMPWLSRAPWVLVVALLLLGLACAWAIAMWPQQVPWGVYGFLVVTAGLFLEPRQLVVVYSGLFATMAIVGSHLGPRKGATLGTELVTVATMLLML